MVDINYDDDLKLQENRIVGSEINPLIVLYDVQVEIFVQAVIKLKGVIVLKMLVVINRVKKVVIKVTQADELVNCFNIVLI